MINNHNNEHKTTWALFILICVGTGIKHRSSVRCQRIQSMYVKQSENSCSGARFKNTGLIESSIISTINKNY